MLPYALRMPSEYMQPEASIRMLLQAAGADLISQKLCPSQRSVSAGDVLLASLDVCPRSLLQGKLAELVLKPTDILLSLRVSSALLSPERSPHL